MICILFPFSASGANQGAIDNRIEQAMVRDNTENALVQCSTISSSPFNWVSNDFNSC